MNNLLKSTLIVAILAVGCKETVQVNKQAYMAQQKQLPFLDSLLKYQCHNTVKYNQYRDSINKYSYIIKAVQE